jgi:hypothetical protein
LSRLGMGPNWDRISDIFVGWIRWNIYPDKLHEVSVIVKYDKEIRAGLPAPMLAEVMRLFGSRACSASIFIGYPTLCHWVSGESNWDGR